MKSLNILKKALKDPVVEFGPFGLATKIGADECACISEWRYGLGEVKYVYHIHKGDFAIKLQEAFNEGKKGGNPKLTYIYLRKDLEDLVLSKGAYKKTFPEYRLYSGPVICNNEKTLKIFEKAEMIIRKNREINDLVLELSQPHVMGGSTYNISSKMHLRRDYIGYRGFLTYEEILDHIKKLKERIK
jgi:hypothetical protein